jgi:serine/threonine protein kinase
MNEVKVMSQLNHPNIIKYYEYNQCYNWFNILMEFADDGDLKQLLYEQKEPLTEK